MVDKSGKVQVKSHNRSGTERYRNEKGVLFTKKPRQSVREQRVGPGLQRRQVTHIWMISEVGTQVRHSMMR